jgi:hypothetical protein
VKPCSANDPGLGCSPPSSFSIGHNLRTHGRERGISPIAAYGTTTLRTPPVLHAARPRIHGTYHTPRTHTLHIPNAPRTPRTPCGLRAPVCTSIRHHRRGLDRPREHLGQGGVVQPLHRVLVGVARLHRLEHHLQLRERLRVRLPAGQPAEAYPSIGPFSRCSPIALLLAPAAAGSASRTDPACTSRPSTT